MFVYGFTTVWPDAPDDEEVCGELAAPQPTSSPLIDHITNVACKLVMFSVGVALGLALCLP